MGFLSGRDGFPTRMLMDERRPQVLWLPCWPALPAIAIVCLTPVVQLRPAVALLVEF